uniref:Uncharacterized protein n=1 Tax=Anguilla anguilla TaxID=7936 RepID=A0A0E9V1T6_ANGAN
MSPNKPLPKRWKVRRKEGTAHDPKHTASSVEYDGGSVMARICMAASGTGSLVIIDDVTENGSSMINSEVYREIQIIEYK